MMLLNIFKKLRKYVGINVEDDEDINYYLEDNYNIKPYSEAIKIAVVYGIGMWEIKYTTFQKNGRITLAMEEMKLIIP